MFFFILGGLKQGPLRGSLRILTKKGRKWNNSLPFAILSLSGVQRFLALGELGRGSSPASRRPWFRPQLSESEKPLDPRVYSQLLITKNDVNVLNCKMWRLLLSLVVSLEVLTRQLTVRDWAVWFFTSMGLEGERLDQNVVAGRFEGSDSPTWRKRISKLLFVAFVKKVHEQTSLKRDYDAFLTRLLTFKTSRWKLTNTTGRPHQKYDLRLPRRLTSHVQQWKPPPKELAWRIDNVTHSIPRSWNIWNNIWGESSQGRAELDGEWLQNTPHFLKHP